MHYHNDLRTPRARNLEVVTAFLDSGDELRIRLSGFSMKPLIPSGSVLRFRAHEEPTIGDIVLMRFADGAGEKLVAHRVLAMDDEHLWTKGDSSYVPDPPVPRSHVLGRATAVELAPCVTLPLRNPWMRHLGCALSKLYPRLVRAYRKLNPYEPRNAPEEARACES